MKKRPILPTIITLLLLVMLSSECNKPPKFSEIPHITFQSIDKIENDLGYDDKAILNIHFQDGDGDIGLDDNDIMAPFDTSSVYFYNWFIDFYEKQNGQLVKINVNNNARIPRLSNTYPEPIEGDLSLEIYINNYFSPYDTVVLECSIVDRELQHSNVIRTPEIIVKKH
ncbi:MAG: hypothetical protein LBV46_02005 [Bacteroidales bacterium]|jgi:hypothetical protein|nr:hypothetical protein [Bacteroidales bacterium]